MKVYEVRSDADNYQFLSQLSDKAMDVHQRIENRRKLSHCKPVTEPLTPPDVYSQQPKLKRGDFWGFAPYSTFAVMPNSISKVRMFLEEAGELLPVLYKTEVFSVFNVLKCVDCVDPETEALGIIHRSCIANRVPSGIFRDLKGVHMFVSEFTGDPATEFKAYVEHEKMTGLIFRG